jgi:DNA repair protein RadC
MTKYLKPTLKIIKMKNLKKVSREQMKSIAGSGLSKTALISAVLMMEDQDVPD